LHGGSNNKQQCAGTVVDERKALSREHLNL
jgi:hypothetical protein